MKNTIKKLPKKNNAADGQKAHNDTKFFKVGRIRYNSWATKVLKAVDIVVSERDLVHIYNSHSAELNQLGMKPFDYVRFIVQNFNEVYEGKYGTKLLLVKSIDIAHYAVVELTFENDRYKIKTAAPIETRRLSKLKLLCANVRRV